MYSNPHDQKSWNRFQEVGLPKPKQEAFQYLPLSKLSFPELAERNFTIQAPQGLVCLPLEEAKRSYGLFMQNRREKTIKEESDPFTLLNRAFGQGFFLYAPPKWEGSLEIHYPASADKMAMPRLEIYLGKGARLELVQTGKPTFTNSAIDAVLDEGAEFSLADLQAPSRQYFSSFRATLKRDSRLKSQLFTRASPLFRASYKVQLLEENSECLLQGLWSLKGEHQCHIHATVEHGAPYTRSRQHFKGILREKSRSSFEGKIAVRPIAQKTEAYQLNNNLILSEEASAHAKPNLEIFADDVKASHGATIGQLDQEQLFYLRSRGLDLDEARQWLVKGFCAELIDAAPSAWKRRLFDEFA